MLYSFIDHRWKIADFGTAAEATSRRLRATAFGRGTASYRAPEALSEDRGYNSKSDIWAFGCVAFELLTGEKAFKDDFETREYRHAHLHSPRKVFGNARDRRYGVHVALAKALADLCVGQTLHCDWNARLSARQLQRSLHYIAQTWKDALLPVKWLDLGNAIPESISPYEVFPASFRNSPSSEISLSYNTSNPSAGAFEKWFSRAN